MNQIREIKVIKGKIKLLSGLHIGGGDSQMKIGGIDNEVIKDQYGKPFIPGSSLKGKIRTLLEWHLGFYNVITDKQTGAIKGGEPSNQDLVDSLSDDDFKRTEKANLVKLFGSKPNSKNSNGVITRLSFWDCPLYNDTGEKAISEAKSENSIDRTQGIALNPRLMERVPAGNVFEFKVVMKIFEGDEEEELKALLKAGLALLQLDSLGGSGSRGYGKIEFQGLEYGDTLEYEDKSEEELEESETGFILSSDDLNILKDE